MVTPRMLIVGGDSVMVNGNPKDVDSGGFSDGNAIEYQGAIWLDPLLLVMVIA